MGDNDDDSGLHFKTDGAWKAKAAAENTLILGESGELVVGGAASVTAGVSIGVILLDLLEVFLGFRQVLSNECKFNFSTEENEVKELKEKVALQLTAIAIGAKIEALEADVKAVQERVDAAGAAWSVHDGKYKAVVAQSALLAKKTDVTTARDAVVGEVNRLLVAQDKTIVDQINLVGQAVGTVALKTNTHGAHLKTALEVTKSVATKTELGAEASEVSAIINEL